MSTFQVNWQGRIMTQEKALYKVDISQAGQGQLIINAPIAFPKQTPINIEFFVEFRGSNERIRAKTEVLKSKRLPANNKYLLTLKITQAEREDIHTLNNILMLLSETTQMNLKTSRS